MLLRRGPTNYPWLAQLSLRNGFHLATDRKGIFLSGRRCLGGQSMGLEMGHQHIESPPPPGQRLDLESWPWPVHARPGTRRLDG